MQTRASALAGSNLLQNNNRVRFVWDPKKAARNLAKQGVPFDEAQTAFAGAGERGGPSLLALWEMPELPPAALLGWLRRGG